MLEKLATRETVYSFPEKPKEKTFGQIIYDKNEGSFFGRTGKEWLRVTIFYIVFYSGLALFFTMCMQGVLASLNYTFPTYRLEDSRIGTNPGVAYRPVPDDSNFNQEIWYNASNEEHVHMWVDRVNQFLAPYKNHLLLPGKGKNVVHCDFNMAPPYNKVCDVDLSKLSPCIADESYGYHKASPCIFLKLNRIFGWEPEYYDDPNNLPNDMPADLVAYIRNLSAADERKQVWFSCKAAHDEDADALGPIDYMPSRGMPGYYYPYLNVEGYMSPLIAVHFSRPAMKRTMAIECRAWAKNIHYHGGILHRDGSILIDLHIE